MYKRLSCLSSSRNPNPNGSRSRPRDVSTPVPVINLSTTDQQAAVASVDNPHAPWSRDVGTVARLPVVPRAQLLSVDNMKQSVSIAAVTSNEGDRFLRSTEITGLDSDGPGNAENFVDLVPPASTTSRNSHCSETVICDVKGGNTNNNNNKVSLSNVLRRTV